MFRSKIADAFTGFYLTPRTASGMSAGMIRALKTTADNIVLSGEESPVVFSLFAAGIAAAKIAGDDGTVFCHIVDDAERRDSPSRHAQLFSDRHHCKGFRGVAIEIDRVRCLFCRLRPRTQPRD